MKEAFSNSPSMMAIVRRISESATAINIATRTIATETNKIDGLKEQIGYSESKTDKGSCSNCLNRADCPISNIGMVCGYLEVEW